jgi:hypothetical protein
MMHSDTAVSTGIRPPRHQHPDLSRIADDRSTTIAPRAGSYCCPSNHQTVSNTTATVRTATVGNIAMNKSIRKPTWME